MLRRIRHITYFFKMYDLYRVWHGWSVINAFKKAKELTSAQAKYR